MTVTEIFEGGHYTAYVPCEENTWLKVSQKDGSSVGRYVYLV